MEKINIDIWIRILEFLPISDQLSVAQVNKRLYGYVKYHWSRQKSLVLSRQVLEQLDRHKKLRKECLTSWSGSLERLEMRSASYGLLKEWRHYCFPHLRVLNCSKYEDPKEPDDDTLLLAQLFPHLTSLTFESNTIRRYMDFTRWSTLKELIIAEYCWLDFKKLNQLINLPHFRRLVFIKEREKYFMFRYVAAIQPLKVRSVNSNLQEIWSYGTVTDCILKMTNLRRLVIQNDAVDSQMLHDICRKLPNLEELHLVGMISLPSPTDFWNSIVLCPKLRILNLSSTLDPGYMTPAMNCPNLNISFEPIDLNSIGSPFLEILFYPN